MLTRDSDIRRFAETAQPGERETYGRGERPPGDLVRAMAAFVEAGVLVPLTKREGGSTLFLVQRGAASLDTVGHRPRCGRSNAGRQRQKLVRRSSLSMVLGVLVRAAREGAACPSNQAIAKACKLSGAAAASYRLRLLIKAGRIAIEDRGPLQPRVVTILTGRHAGKTTFVGEK